MKKTIGLLVGACICFALFFVAVTAAAATIPVPKMLGCIHGYGIDDVEYVAVYVNDDPSVEGYIFYRSTDGISYAEIGRSTLPDFDDVDVEDGVTYFYKAACYLNGEVGALSDPVSFTFEHHPARPKLKKITLSSDGHPVLSWTASDYTPGDVYTVFRGETEFEAHEIDKVTAQTYTDNDALAAGTYYYSITVKRAGKSSFSDTRSITLDSPVGAPADDPSIPVPAMPTCGCSYQSQTQTYGVYVLMTDASEPLVETAAYYRSTDGISYTEIARKKGGIYIDEDVTDGVTYYYKVAYCRNGVVGEPSAAREYTFLIRPMSVSLSVTLSDGRPVLSWTAHDAMDGDLYILRRAAAGEDAAEIARVSGSTYTDTTAQAGGTYTYTVTALRGDRESIAPSKSVEVTLPDTLPVPENLGCSHGSNAQGAQGVALYATNDPSVEGYIFYRSTDDVLYTEIGRRGLPYYLDFDVEDGVTYFYKAACYLNGVVGPMSESVSYTFERYPDPPVLQSIRFAGGRPVLSWTASDYAAGDVYTVLRGVTAYDGTGIADVTAQTYTDTEALAAGTYYYSVMVTRAGKSSSSDTVSVTLPYVAGAGDADGDGEITVLDALFLLRSIVDKTAVNGDLDGDGKITLVDLLRLFKQIAS